MFTTSRSALFLALCSLCLGESAIADEFHNNNMLIGDRASGMGGAYTAISDDATGMYYNPASIVYVGDKNVSASVNAYFFQSKKYDNVIGNQAFERKSSSLLANYFGVVKPLGIFKVGFSYAVPDAVSEDQNQIFTDFSTTGKRFTINLNNRDNTINYGPSIAAEINPDTAIGLTLYAHQRDVQLGVNQFTERKDSTTAWSNQYFRLNEKGMRPVLGVSWAPSDKVALGFSLSKTFVLTSNGTNQLTCWDTNAGGCDTTTTAPSIKVPAITTYSLKREYPTRLALGVGYFANRNLIISSDLTYHTAVTDPIYGNKVATINAALGTEYYLSKKWAVRAGMFTNMANTPTIQAGSTQFEEQINLYGASLSVSNFTGSSSVTLGGSVNYGQGKSQITGDTSVQDASTLGWLLFLSSSY